MEVSARVPVWTDALNVAPTRWTSLANVWTWPLKEFLNWRLDPRETDAVAWVRVRRAGQTQSRAQRQVSPRFQVANNLAQAEQAACGEPGVR
jgi:hypothetical protein